jgi:hypothetical protein
MHIMAEEKAEPDGQDAPTTPIYLDTALQPWLQKQQKHCSSMTRHTAS